MEDYIEVSSSFASSKNQELYGQLAIEIIKRQTSNISKSKQIELFVQSGIELSESQNVELNQIESYLELYNELEKLEKAQRVIRLIEKKDRVHTVKQKREISNLLNNKIDYDFLLDMDGKGYYSIIDKVYLLPEYGFDITLPNKGNY